MAKTAKKIVKKTAKANKSSKVQTTPSQPQALKKPAEQLSRLQKRLRAGKLPSAFQIFKDAITVLAKHWKLFLGIAVVYGLLNILLVQGFKGTTGFGETKSALEQLFTGNFGHVGTGLTLFLYLVSSSGNATDPAAGMYQFVLILIVSLALIWTFRQVYAGQKVRIRDGFYSGMSPLVKFVLVLLVIGLELIPLTIGAMLYGVVTANGIAVSAFEQIVWALGTFLLTLLSLYMISSSLFGLYIVTLPDMTPLLALRSARQLVRYRRWTVMRKIVFLPLILLVLTGVIVVPIIMYATPVAVVVFFVLSMFLLPVAHSYLYALYRSLL